VRAAVLLAGALVLAAVLVIMIGMSVAPISRSCARGLVEDACEGAVEAVLRRGLPALHPLILAATVEPGLAEAGELGHRATVTFDLLGVPGATRVALYFDRGGHWGGESDRSETEVAAWTLLPLLLASAVGIGLVAVGWRRRGPTAGAGP